MRGGAGVLCQAERGGFWCVVGDPFKGAVESGGHATGRHDSEVSLQASVQAEVGDPGCPCSRDLGLPQLLGIIQSPLDTVDWGWMMSLARLVYRVQPVSVEEEACLVSPLPSLILTASQ